MLFSGTASHGRRVMVRAGALLASPPAFSHAAAARITHPRKRLSKIWVPTGGVSAVQGESGHGKLLRAGFLRQSQSGIFQLLPLGLRVQQKIEKLLDKHLQSIGASRLSLSTISSEELWRKSGRLDKVSAELFRFMDRKDTPLMLSPTHEEEITALVASTLKSHKDLPLRLYQTTRKYRDEMRPRHGLLRSREFVMNDLYTFDASAESAIETYRDVSGAYRAFFADLKIPILVAEASSGDMGGDHSHEYHLASAIGEDTVASCGSCGYTANNEVAKSQPPRGRGHGGHASARHWVEHLAGRFRVWRGVTKDRRTLVNAWYPAHAGRLQEAEINVRAVKEAVPQLDASISDPIRALREAAAAEASSAPATPRVVNVVDARLVPAFGELQSRLPTLPAEFGKAEVAEQHLVVATGSGEALNLVRPADGNGCPRCATGTLHVQRALELGHTFFLGSRYSTPMELLVSLPNAKGGPVPVQMGCYGIGVSRIFGAVAEHGADERGLRWPRAVAPFEVVVIPSSSSAAAAGDALAFYDSLNQPDVDAVLDDRQATFGWKMHDADTIGYPVAVVLGRAWRESGVCEVQCRSLGVREQVGVGDVGGVVRALLARL